MHKYGSKQKGSNSLFIFVIKITPLLGGGWRWVIMSSLIIVTHP